MFGGHTWQPYFFGSDKAQKAKLLGMACLERPPLMILGIMVLMMVIYKVIMVAISDHEADHLLDHEVDHQHDHEGDHQHDLEGDEQGAHHHLT